MTNIFNFGSNIYWYIVICDLNLINVIERYLSLAKEAQSTLHGSVFDSKETKCYVGTPKVENQYRFQWLVPHGMVPNWKKSHPWLSLNSYFFSKVHKLYVLTN